MLCQSVRRVPPPSGSSSHRMSKPPQLYSSSLGASARVTVVSDTCGLGAPTVVSFTVAPAVARLPSASKGAHSRSCAGSVSASQTFSGGWRSSRTRTSVHFSPSFSYLRAAGRTRCVLLAIVHLLFLVFFFVGVDRSMRSRWRSSAST